MSHSISGVVVASLADPAQATRLGFRHEALTDQWSLLLYDDALTDELAESLGASGAVADVPELNFRSIHKAMEVIAPGAVFALVWTDYFGGHGEQAAAVYKDGTELMPPAMDEIGPINEALRRLGVRRRGGRDEFDSIGLGRFRSFGGRGP